MLATIGDLVLDVVVWPVGPLRRGTDTAARVYRRRGGSAANVAVAAARIEGRAAFVGMVGSDPTGDELLAELVAAGVEPRVVRQGTTGTIVVIVDPAGERSFLTDRGVASGLATIDPAWLDGVDALHVPAYSLADEPLRSATLALVERARARGIPVSADASSVAVVEALDPGWVDQLRPAILLCNEDEAAVLGDRASAAGELVVKAGAAPTRVDGRAVGAPPEPPTGVLDTTGAGDAFAAAYVLARRDGRDVSDAVRCGHDLAGRTLATPGAGLA